MLKFIKQIFFRTALISFIGIGLLSAVFAANSPVTKAPLTVRRLIIFGDSLSDNGNLYSLTVQIHKFRPEVPIIPNAMLYWHGRFSNGPVWNEYLASMLHFLPDEIEPTATKSDRFKNYAYAGSWAETTQPDINHYTVNNKQHNFPPPLSTQIDQYLEIVKASNPTTYKETLAHDLVFLWAGGNDYLNQEFDGPPLARSPEISTNAVIQVIHKNILKLIETGNKNIMIVGMPDLSRIPDILFADPNHNTLVPNLALTSKLHNQKLLQLVTTLQGKYPNVNLMFMDVYKIFHNLFDLAQLRQQQYALLHQGLYQRFDVPCLLETVDPDPYNMTSQKIHLSHILAMATGPKLTNKLLRSAFTFPKCDYHKEGDQLSLFNYKEFHDAGGIFFDHIHPTTHVHAHLALKFCKLLQSHGYQIFLSTQNQYQPLQCAEYSEEQLVHKISNPPFPS